MKLEDGNLREKLEKVEPRSFGRRFSTTAPSPRPPVTWAWRKPQRGSRSLPDRVSWFAWIHTELSECEQRNCLSTATCARGMIHSRIHDSLAHTGYAVSSVHGLPSFMRNRWIS